MKEQVMDNLSALRRMKECYTKALIKRLQNNPNHYEWIVDTTQQFSNVSSQIELLEELLEEN